MRCCEAQYLVCRKGLQLAYKKLKTTCVLWCWAVCLLQYKITAPTVSGKNIKTATINLGCRKNIKTTTINLGCSNQRHVVQGQKDFFWNASQGIVFGAALRGCNLRTKKLKTTCVVQFHGLRVCCGIKTMIKTAPMVF